MEAIQQNKRLIHLKTREAIMGVIFVAPSMAGFLLFYFLPYVKSLYYCFTSGIGSTFVGVGNFIDLMQSQPYQLALKNTAVFLVTAILLVIVISFSAALLLKKAPQVFTVIILIPLIIPAASITAFFKIIFSEYGMINGFLASINMNSVNFIDSGWSTIVLLSVYLWKYTGYNTILYLTALNSVPAQYYESATLDGAGKLRCLVHITVPFCVPISFFVFIISFVNSFKIFREVLLLFGIYPEDHVYLIQHFMNNNFFNLSYQRLSTAAFMMVIFVIAVVTVCFRLQENVRKNLQF